MDFFLGGGGGRGGGQRVCWPPLELLVCVGRGGWPPVFLRLCRV